MPEPPRLSQFELMFGEDLTLVDDLNQLFHRAHALVNTVAELIGEPPYVPITMARAAALAEIAIDLLEQVVGTPAERGQAAHGRGGCTLWIAGCAFKISRPGSRTSSACSEWPARACTTVLSDFAPTESKPCLPPCTTPRFYSPREGATVSHPAPQSQFGAKSDRTSKRAIRTACSRARADASSSTPRGMLCCASWPAGTSRQWRCSRHGRATDAVPNSVARGPDGAYYVGELTGAPFAAGAARVYRVVPGQPWQVFLDGFTAIIDLTFGPDGSLYVLQHATEPGLAGDGALIRVAPDGTRTIVTSAGLVRPTAVVIAPTDIDGHRDDDDADADAVTFYISDCGTCVGVGEVIRIQP